MYRVLFRITGVIVGTCLGFLVSWLGPELLYGLHLVIGGIFGAFIGCVLGVTYGNAVGAKIENTLSERAILLLFWIVLVIQGRGCGLSYGIRIPISQFLGMNHVRFPSGCHWPGTLLTKFEIVDSQNVQPRTNI
jgi:hypothetical protein